MSKERKPVSLEPIAEAAFWLGVFGVMALWIWLEYSK